MVGKIKHKRKGKTDTFYLPFLSWLWFILLSYGYISPVLPGTSSGFYSYQRHSSCVFLYNPAILQDLSELTVCLPQSYSLSCSVGICPFTKYYCNCFSDFWLRSSAPHITNV
jgi:hypothetical protein